MRERKLEPLSGVFALPPEEAAAATSTSSDAPEGVPADELTSFRDAGWAFTSRSAENARPVYRDGAGHILVGGRQMTLKFTNEATPAQIGEYLRRRALSLVRRTGIRRDKYVVKFDAPEADIVDVCQSLERDREIAWAEPDLIEAIRGRRGE